MSVAISVLVPAYNASRFIQSAIESCLAQTLPDFEVVVVDDASTDDTADRVAACEDERVRLIRLTENRGPGGARNVALQHAAGKWCTMLDADDWYAPTRLEVMLGHAERLGVESILFDQVQMMLVSPDGRSHKYRINNAVPGSRKHKGEALEIAPDEFIRLRVSAKTFYARERALRHDLYYPEHLWFGEDFAWVVEALNVPGTRIHQVCEPLYFRRVVKGSLTGHPEKMARLAQMHDYLLNQVPLRPELHEAVEIRARQLEHLEDYERFRQQLLAGDLGGALRHLRKCPGHALRFLRYLPSLLAFRLRVWLTGSESR